MVIQRSLFRTITEAVLGKYKTTSGSGILCETGSRLSYIAKQFVKTHSGKGGATMATIEYMGRFVVWMSRIDLVIAIRAMCMPNVATGTSME